MTQNEALSILKTGANVFLTGEPGSGKTHTVRHFVSWLREHGVEPAVTASTGIAATHINGHTIHSWSGIGVRKELAKSDLNMIAGNKRAANRMRAAHTLIIDEISMLSAQTLDMAEAACRAIRENAAPFGGLQVVLVGDFFQLPPVMAREESGEAGSMIFDGAMAETRSFFAFSSSVWRKLDLNVCYLSEQHRQEDPAFLEILSAIRSGTVSQKHRALLETRFAKNEAGGITQFFSRNADVDRVNNAELSKLSGNARTFVMESRGQKNIAERLKRGCLSPEVLALKIDSKVMFTKNDIPRHRFVNGTLGTIVGFTEENGNPIVKTNAGHTIIAEPAEWSVEDGGKILARITQIPLRLAWAITVHKSQGMSLDAAHMDLSDAFEHGQGYVAISRVRTLAGLSLAGFNEKALEVHPEIAARDIEFRKASYRAQENLKNIPRDEIENKQDNFLRICGGNPEPVKIANREENNFIIKKRVKKNGPRWEQTLAFMREGKTIEESARLQNRKLSTIIDHIQQLLALRKLDVSDISHLARGNEKVIAEIHSVFRKLGADRLKPVHDYFNGHFSYEIIRLARLLYKR